MSAACARWLAAAVVVLLVAGALVWSTVGGNRGQSASTSTAGQAAELQQGGTVTFAGGGEPTGFNINTSKDGGPEVQNIIANVYPSVFRTHPDLVARLDTEVMDGAELTAEEPQTITYRIRATRSGRTGRRSGPMTSSTSGSSRTAPSKATTFPRPPATRTSGA